MTYVATGPFIILSGRIDILSSPSSSISDLSETALLWTTRFLIMRIFFQPSLSFSSSRPISPEATSMSLRYILPPLAMALERTSDALYILMQSLAPFSMDDITLTNRFLVADIILSSISSSVPSSPFQTFS